jgi:preprotein translocase subunit Sss1
MGTLALFLGLAIIALGIIGFVVPLRARKADRKDRTNA